MSWVEQRVLWAWLVECAGWDKGGRTQDVGPKLEVVSVCREPFDGGKHDVPGRRPLVSAHSTLDLEWSTHALLKSTWSCVSLLCDVVLETSSRRASGADRPQEFLCGRFDSLQVGLIEVQKGGFVARLLFELADRVF